MMDTKPNQAMTLNQIVDLLRQELPHLAPKYQLQTLSLFGSYIRHEQHQASDLDVLVTYSKTPDLFAFIELQYLLTDMLGVTVDLVMKEGLKPRIAQQILAEEMPMYHGRAYSS